MSVDDSLIESNTRTIRLGDVRWLTVYAVLATVVQWPLVASLTTHVSLGSELDATVPLLNLWTVWWNADRIANGFQGYWNAPIFYPTQNTFIFSEAQPTSLIVAPISLLTGNCGLAYNVYQLLILTLNGFSAHRLLRRLGHIPWMAFCGGVMSQNLPFVLWQFGVVQLTTLFGIYWVLHAILDLFGTAIDRSEISLTDIDEQHADHEDRPWLRLNWTIGARLGCAYGLTYWACNYWGLFLTLLFVPCSVCFWNRRLWEHSFWRQIGVATFVAVIMIGPMAWLQHSMSRQHGWQALRTADLVFELSAHWRDYTDVPWRNCIRFLEAPDPARENIFALGGGGVKLLLAPLGLAVALFNPRRRRWGMFAALMGVFSFGLSLGTTVQFLDRVPFVGGITPYAILQAYVPGFSLIRSPFRFAMFVQLAVVWLSVELLAALHPACWLTRRGWITESERGTLPSWMNSLFGFGSDDRVRWPVLIPLVLMSLMFTLEVIPPVTRLYELPARRGIPAWVQWLRDEAELGQAVAFLPFPRGNTAADYEETTLWMYWGTFFRHPLANGYSGFFPDHFIKMREGLEQFQRPVELGPNDPFVPHFKDYAWDNPGITRLNEGGIRYVVMKRSFGNQSDVAGNRQTKFRWASVFSDDDGEIDIYQLPLGNDESEP